MRGQAEDIRRRQDPPHIVPVAQPPQARAECRRASDEARATNDTVHSLAEAAGRIGEVVRLIGDIAGQAKIVSETGSGKVLGVHIIGAHATDLISEAATAMSLEAFVEDLSEAVKPHPTLSETVSEAALSWRNLAIHLPASGASA